MFNQELIEKCCNYIKNRQLSVVTEFSELSNQIQNNLDPETSGETFARNIKQRFTYNLNALNQFFGGRTADMHKKLSNRLYYNPIDYVLECGLDLLGDDENIACKIAEGKLQPNGFHDTNIPELGAGNFWGSTQPSIYGNILQLMARNSSDPVHLYQASSFMHVTPISAELALPLYNSEYLYQNGDQYGLAFAHTGYVYNGNRIDDVLYTNIKAYAPKDCSQYVQEMLGLNNKFITEDMLYTFRNKSSSGYIRKNWLDSEIANELCTNLIPVAIDDIQPGDIHVKWDFKKSNKPTNSRTHVHGHTTIVFSKQGSEVLTLGDGQSVPYRDGFGLELYSAMPTEVFEHHITETRFFRSTNKSKF